MFQGNGCRLQLTVDRGSPQGAYLIISECQIFELQSQSSDRFRSCPRPTQTHHSNAKTISWYTHASPIQLARRKTPLSLEGDLPLREVDVLLVLLLGDSRSLLGGQSSSDSTGLLVSEVKGEVLGLLVELPEVLPLLLVDDSEDSGNGLADSVDLGQLASRATGDLLHPQRGKLSLELGKLLQKVLLALGLELKGSDLG